jgi:O-antigen/teichoic acid export membrane protein
VLGVIYGEAELVAPGLVMAATLALGVLNAPTWVFYRRMDFVRQRLLLGIEPVVAFVVTLALAVAGAGYWSLVLGALVGAAVSSIVILMASPYRLRVRYDHGTAKQYVSFSWPLIVAGGASIVIAQGSVLAGESVAGLAGAGAITLAATMAQYSDRVDQIVTQALYPAICAVRDRKDLLFEAFVKSNRLTLIWGLPFGVGLSLFAGDLVEFGLGEGWEPAVVLLEVFGLTAAVGHIGFNWDAFYRAQGETRPIAIWSAVTMFVFLAVPLPLLITEGLEAFAIGIAAMTAVSFAIKGYFLTRLFSGFRMLSHGARALAPTVPAVAAVLGLRAVESSSRGLGAALAELALYLVICAVATWAVERTLLREVGGYLRGALASPPAAAP